MYSRRYICHKYSTSVGSPVHKSNGHYVCMTCRQLINIITLGHFSRTSVYGRSIILTENKARYIKKTNG